MSARTVAVVEPDDKFAKALALYLRGSGWEATFLDAEGDWPSAVRELDADVLLLAAEAMTGLRTRSSADESELPPTVLMAEDATLQRLFPAGIEAEAIAELGAKGCLRKPFIKASLLRALNSTVTGTPIPLPEARSGCRGQAAAVLLLVSASVVVGWLWL